MTKNKHVQNKQTNAREAHRPAPSFISEAITILKGMTKHEDKEHRKTLKQEVAFHQDKKKQQQKKNSYIICGTHVYCMTSLLFSDVTPCPKIVFQRVT